MELKQRKLFNSNKFLIRDNGLEWPLIEKFNSQNTFFEFEELNFKKAEEVAKMFSQKLNQLNSIFKIYDLRQRN